MFLGEGRWAPRLFLVSFLVPVSLFGPAGQPAPPGRGVAVTPSALRDGGCRGFDWFLFGVGAAGTASFGAGGVCRAVAAASWFALS